MTQQTAIRGLAIRANFALARAIFQATGDAEAEFDMGMSVNEAQWLGFNERFAHRQTCVPAMFADEPQLRNAWLAGHDRAVSARLDLQDSKYAVDEEEVCEQDDAVEEVTAC
jgi:hypothetical protein